MDVVLNVLIQSIMGIVPDVHTVTGYNLLTVFTKCVDMEQSKYYGDENEEKRIKQKSAI